jgi:hypothetical protein
MVVRCDGPSVWCVVCAVMVVLSCVTLFIGHF